MRANGIPRARTESMRRVSRTELRRGLELYPPEPHERPTTRGDCEGNRRPCPFVSCRYHLYLDVNRRTGSIKINFPDREVWELENTCTLDVAARGGVTLEAVGEIMNITRERVRQIEQMACAKVAGAMERYADGC